MIRQLPAKRRRYPAIDASRPLLITHDKGRQTKAGSDAISKSHLTRLLFGGMLRRIAALRSPARWASRRPKQISVLSETGEGKVFEEWVGEASVFGFEILPQPSDRLCPQTPGWTIAY